jgi:hypothetical protein
VLFAQVAEEVIAPKKDYSVFFPDAGTIILGADAAQFIKFLGAQTFGRINNNMSDSDTPVQGYQGNLFGKYFLSDKVALRARLEMMFLNQTKQEFVRDDYQYYNDPYSTDLTVDKYKGKNGLFTLGIGAEYRRSLWRLQGYIGGELFFGMGYGNHRFEYGNSITDFNQNPSTTNFVLQDQYGNTLRNMYPSINGRPYLRILNTKGKNFNYGGTVFTGVDYFFSKNVSLGLEFDLRANATYECESVGVVERWANNRLETREEAITPTGRSFQIMPIGYLNLMFYF